MCFCLASHHEAFSMAITEALACRLPVVVSRECFFPEVAEVGAGEVVELDADQIAAALVRIARDSELRQRMGEAGRTLVEERFTWPRIAEQTIELYEQVRSGALS
jgi:glycosyltransferase involved in cell wall biosynthesis